MIATVYVTKNFGFRRGEIYFADTVYPALEAIKDKNLLPFAIDPFGNYICYQLDRKQIVYWDHESEDRKSTRLNSSHDRQSRMPSSA